MRRVLAVLLLALAGLVGAAYWWLDQPLTLTFSAPVWSDQANLEGVWLRVQEEQGPPRLIALAEVADHVVALAILSGAESPPG